MDQDYGRYPSGRAVAADAVEPVPVSPVPASIPSAFEALRQAMLDDPEYAWGWHCNIAMPIMDSIGCTHEQANYAAAWLMMHLFGWDAMAHPAYAYRGEHAKAQGIAAPGDKP